MVLTVHEAVEIYTFKVAARGQLEVTGEPKSLKGASVALAKKYGVTPRTIRDIWNRHSWSYATQHLWTYEEESKSCVNAQSFLQVRVEKFLLSDLH